MKADNNHHPGEPFNPWREACGFYPPEVVGRHKSFGDGPKRLYEYLVRRMGRKSYCWPSQKTIALALGKGERQIRNDLSVLRKVGLIRKKDSNTLRPDDRRRRFSSDIYEALWHPIFDAWLEGKVRADNGKSSGNSNLSPDNARSDPPEVERRALGHSDPQTFAGVHQQYTASGGRPNAATNARQDIAAESNQGNLRYRNSLHQKFSASKDTDLSISERNRKTDDDIEAQTQKFFGARGFRWPSGPIPVSKIAQLLTASRARIEVYRDFLEDYESKLKEPPRSWKHLEVSLERYLTSGESVEFDSESPPKVLKASPDCTKCHGTGWIIIECQGVDAAERCTCTKTTTVTVGETAP